jgi:hypothetical protein
VIGRMFFLNRNRNPNPNLATGLDKVPKGRLKSAEMAQPALRDLTFHHSPPSVETLGYFHLVPPGHHFVRCFKNKKETAAWGTLPIQRFNRSTL